MPDSKSLATLADVAGATLTIPDGFTAPEPIEDVTHDSRQAGPNTLFVAIPGALYDGHDFVDQAVASGSRVICVEHPTDSDVAELVVPDTRKALGLLAAAVHGNPSAHMSVVGVTGTNGKTTVTHYMESMAARVGVSAGLIGTIHTKIAGVTLESKHTTPEASDFQRLLARMVEAGIRLVAVEVSSHALELWRVAGTEFSVAVFTNLSQDHLDFHHSMESYLAAKRRLFEEYPVGTAVINIDDVAGAALARSFTGTLVTVGTGGDCFHSHARPVPGGTEFRLVTPWGSAELIAPVVGGFNLDNAVLAVAGLLAAGLEFDDVVNGLTVLDGVPGRYEVISGDDPIRVIVDYAHTPAGVEKALTTARTLGGRRLIAVMGAGGDRDRAKRPIMGKAVSGADIAVVTSDNPRSEDPEEIIRAVTHGVEQDVELIVEVDRRNAINRAIEVAEDGDIVLVLGRGHEPTQEVQGEHVAFDDREVARAALLSVRMSADTGAESGSMET